MFSSATQPPAAASQFRCQRDKTTFFKLDTCITHPNISDEFDNWHCRLIQNGRRWPFCQNKNLKKRVAYRSEMARNVIKSYFRTSKMAAGIRWFSNQLFAGLHWIAGLTLEWTLKVCLQLLIKKSNLTRPRFDLTTIIIFYFIFKIQVHWIYYNILLIIQLATRNATFKN